MANIASITGLLNKLNIDSKEGTSWRMSCCFTDGAGMTFHKIYICNKSKHEEKVIVFQMETGQVMNYVCKGIQGTDNMDIVDVLLDLINEQKVLSPH